MKTANEIFKGVFKRKKKVNIKDVSDFLKTELGMFNVTVTGTQDEKGFASSLTSYNDFRRILGREIETASDYEMVEKLITWVTVFEDKRSGRRKITQTYGPEATGELTNEQIKAVTKLRYTGWSKTFARVFGRPSRRLRGNVREYHGHTPRQPKLTTPNEPDGNTCR